MKQYHLIFCISMLLFQAACKKSVKTDNKTIETQLIEESRQYFERNIIAIKSNSVSSNNPRKDVKKYPVWHNAEIKLLQSGQKVVCVPVNYKNPYLIKNNFSNDALFNSNEVSRLLIYKDKKQKFRAEFITCLPDSNFVNKVSSKFSGIILVENWNFSSLGKYVFSYDGTIKKYIPPSTKNHQETGSQSDKGSITFCYYIEGYNYSPSNPSNTYYWSELIGCQTSFFSSYKEYTNTDVQPVDYSGMFGGAVAGPATVISVTSGDKIISNLQEYMKCFINVPGTDHKYEITVCVAQPNPGTRNTYGVNSADGSSASKNPIYVGHSFFILKETTPTKTVIRNIGFYPSTGVNPYSPTSTGAYNNDEDRDYDISLTISVTNSEFFKLLNYINLGNNNSFTYNLNSFNCTNFVINALNTIGINLPQTQGTWPNGQGLNPGDLGEDIRGMTLASNMTRTTAYGTHPNRGTCY